MRFMIIVLALIVGGLYFTVGVRLGMVTIMPTHMFNAQGLANYTLRIVQEDKTTGVRGTCEVKNGSAVLRLYNTQGVEVGSNSCSQKGKFSVALLTKGAPGNYELRIDYKKFTGKMDIVEVGK